MHNHMGKKEEKNIPLKLAIGLMVLALAVGAAGGYLLAPKAGTSRSDSDWPSTSFRRDGMTRPDGGREGLRDGTMPGGSRFAGGMNMVRGDIVSIDGRTITIGLEDGSSKVVVLTSDTQISRMELIDMESLESGTHVFVTAETDDMGNLIATMLQIRPEELDMFRGGMGPPPVEQ
ncbi:hypothetical protein AMJ57_04905 [Parcubacteria bacterium SG8_24]|nr:MAG: hypothetical protein AMJ57_04905 [Parcubacteria bacterium SG8_24]